MLLHGSSIVWLNFQVVLIQPVEEDLVWLVGCCIASLQSGDWAVQDQVICILGGLVAFCAGWRINLSPPVFVCCCSAVSGPYSVRRDPLSSAFCKVVEIFKLHAPTLIAQFWISLRCVTFSLPMTHNVSQSYSQLLDNLGRAFYLVSM